MEQRQTFISLSLDGERVRKSERESFDALKMIITISKSASEENVLPSLCPIPSSPAPYHLIQLHNDCLGQGGLWVVWMCVCVCVSGRNKARGGGGEQIVTLRAPQITYGTNKKMMRIKGLIIPEIR